MKLAALFSGGKDSVYAIHLARKQGHEIVCLLTVESENPHSYMFHTPNINWTASQAEAIGLPLVTITTKGEKEHELADLSQLIRGARKQFRIEGVVTGAIESNYQRERIEQICKTLNLKCLSPLWKTDQIAYLKRLVRDGFKVIIVGVFAEPFDDSWLGREIDEQAISDLAKLERSHKIQPSGEGGELETFVLDAPGWNKKLSIDKASKQYENFAGVFTIHKLKLTEK